MKNLFILLLPLLLCYTGRAQSDNDVQSIKGKVINKVTNEAISFTNISIDDTFYGTASDEDGNFELKIPEEMISREIHFSAVGFQREKFPVTSLLNREYTIIKLEPQSYKIEDIDIEARSKVIIRILRMASENIPYNFIGGPFNLLAGYENKKIIDDSIHVNQNAGVLIFDKTGYKRPSALDAFKMRKYEIKKDEPDYRFSKTITNFDELLELDWVRSASSVLNPSLANKFELAIEDEPIVDGKPAWVISFTQQNPCIAGSGDFYAASFEGEITILKEDYSVKKIEGSVSSTKNNRQGRSLGVGNSNSNYFTNVKYVFKISYSRLKPDLFYLHKNYTFNGKQIEETSRLTVNQVKMTDLKEITTRDYFAD